MEQCGRELGHPVGQLITPLTRRADRGVQYAVDNGAFAGFKEKAFIAILKRQQKASNRCLFVAAPDVVGSAAETHTLFFQWHERLKDWPIAFVAQDGIEDVWIPWSFISALFIGGSTDFKLGAQAEKAIIEAKRRKKWVHIGRINTAIRFDRFKALGADSCDGTGISRYSHMRQKLSEGLPLFDQTAQS